MAADDPIRLLASFPLFSTLPPEVTEQLARSLRPREIDCGQALVRQGEPGDSLFLVTDGRFEARVAQPDGEPRAIGVVGRGETVGEMAVITAGSRNCTVIATRRSSVLELSGEDFLRVLELHPAALFALTRRMVQRSAQQMPSSPVRRVAILPLDPRTDTSWLAKSLGEALGAFGSTARLGRALVLAEHGQTGEDSRFTVPRLSVKFLDWLAEQERSHEFVVYEAMHAGGEWTRRCLAQADLILLVGSAGEPPEPAMIEQDLLGPDRPITLAPAHLVLLRPDRASRPSGTARWLDAREIELHHHVAVGDHDDVRRLARIITGRAVQLVLSGGGARGFAGIGVIRALREAGIPIDLVGGASCGSLLASLCAMEWDAARMRDTLKTWIPRLKDPTFPFLSLFSAGVGSRAARAICDGWSIEDLPIGYFAVSTDLSSAQEVVHRRGPLWLALRASTSVPGAFPPLVMDGRCLVDGGVLNNLPIDVMARLAPGRIVAVDSSRQVSLDSAALQALENAADGSTSGWRLLWRRLMNFLRGRKAPVLHLGDLVARASEVAAVRIAREIQARTPVALRIEPPVDGYQMLDFDQIEPIVEAGYTFASAHAEGWKRSLLAG